MKENRFFSSVGTPKYRAAAQADASAYDNREYRTELHGCKVTVRFRRDTDTELAKKTIAPLMNCFDMRVNSEKTA